MLSDMGIFQKNGSLFEIKLESSGLRRTGGDFAMPIGQSYIGVSKIHRKKRPEAGSQQNAKTSIIS